MKTIVFEEKEIIPSKIVCIGRNYVDHINELGNEIPDEMVVFVKPNSSISTKLISFHQEPLHFEAELCFLYQKDDKQVQGKFTAVAIGLDLTKRALQNKLKTKGLPWERAKSFNGAAVFSDFVKVNPIDSNLSLELFINDKLAQKGGVNLMMFKPDAIISSVSTFMDLEDGDIVMTGTPKGVGEIAKGSEFIGKVKQGNHSLVSASWVAE